MATITIRGFIQVRIEEDGKPHFHFMLSEDMRDYGFTCIGPHDIHAEVPDDADYVPKQRAALERARAAALDEAARAEREIALLGAIGKTE